MSETQDSGVPVTAAAAAHIGAGAEKLESRSGSGVNTVSWVLITIIKTDQVKWFVM